MIITNKWLKDNQACLEGIKDFSRLYPKGLDISGLPTKEIILVIQNLSNWIDWIYTEGLQDEIGIDLTHRNFDGANFELIDLGIPDFRGSSFKDAKLSESSAQHGNFEDCDFLGAEMNSIELFCANLKDSYLRGVDLQYAQLGNTNLQGADLRKADLRVANLRRSDLRGADLTGANLKRANLNWAIYDGNTVFPKGFDPKSDDPRAYKMLRTVNVVPTY